MATVNFLYRSTRKEAFLSVRLLYRFDAKDYTIEAKTKELVSGQFFTEKYKKKKNIDAALRKQQTELRERLDKIESHIFRHFANLDGNDYCILNKEWLQVVIDEYYNPTVEVNTEIPNTLLSYLDYYLDANPHLQYGTIKKFTALKSRLLRHLDEPDINIEEINDNYKKRVSEALKTYDSNTVLYTFKLIKTILNHARRKGANVHMDVANWEFSFKSNPVVFLNPQEQESIKDLIDLPEHLNNVRDWLLIGCNTGQRVSDLLRFDSTMIRTELNRQGKEITLLEITQEKTGKDVAIPLNDEVKRILSKRGGEFPYRISSQKFNEHIKEVCKLAGMIEPTKGNKITVNDKGIKRKISGTFPKYELCSSHICRRSFCSNYFGKVPNQLIMAVSGHVTEREFLKYIGKTNTELSKNFADYF